MVQVPTCVEPSGLFYRLYRQKLSGSVRLRYGQRWHTVQLLRGLIRRAPTAGDTDLLGQLLLRQGRLDRRELARSLERLSGSDRPQGELLRQMGLVSAVELEQVLVGQLRRRLLRLLSLGAADEVRTTQDAPGRLLGPGRPLHPLNVIWDHVQRLPETEVARLRRQLSRALVGLHPGAEAPLSLAGHEGLDLLLVLRRPRSLESLAATPAQLRLLLFLAKIGLLSLQRAPAGRTVAGAPAPRAHDRDLARRAFHRLALRLHPDRHPSASPEERARLAERFAQAAAAYREMQSRGRTSAP